MLNDFENKYGHRIAKTPFGVFDLDVKGHFILNSDKTFFKIMIFDPLSHGYYRGENKYHGERFTSSWQRIDKLSEQCLQWIQKKEFIDWFIRSPYFEHFAYNMEFAENPNIPEGKGAKFCFDFEAIAQHYGFATNYLDITTNKDVAEFFAYTYRNEAGKLVPVEKFGTFKPYIYSSFASEKLLNPHNVDIKIVGFQTLWRPVWQYAMAIDLSNTSINYKDEFTCTALPEEKEKAFAIYDKFEGGAKLFPNDFAQKSEIKIKHRVTTEKIINKEIFLRYCEEFKFNQNDIETRLKRQGYNFTNDKFEFTDEQKQEIKKEIESEIIPWINEFTGYSNRSN